MQMILMVVQAIGETLGSLVLAALLCWLLWQGFKLVHHPAWAIWVVLLVPVLAVRGNLPKSEFLDMALAFVAVAALPLWIEGRNWRKRHLKERSSPQNPVLV